MGQNQHVTVTPSGWPLRQFTIDELTRLLTACAPRLIEISKDSIRDDVSLKDLAHALTDIRALHSSELSFAGTTDLVRCAKFSWERYRQYLAIQFAQARFLDASLFRILLGSAGSTTTSVGELTDRVKAVCRDLAPIQVCIEIHAGAESEPVVLTELLRCTPVRFVIDFENMQRAELTSDRLLELIPNDRIAYFHQRNLPGVWIEHQESLQDECLWHGTLPEAPFLWEPKTVTDPKRIQDLFYEYRSTN